VQTRTELVPTPAATLGSAAKRHHVFSVAYVHMHQGKYVVVRDRLIECLGPVSSRSPLGGSPGNQPAALSDPEGALLSDGGA